MGLVPVESVEHVPPVYPKHAHLHQVVLVDGTHILNVPEPTLAEQLDKAAAQTTPRTRAQAAFS